ncbi:HTH-type transcriptional regulator RcdA [Pseudoclavibacter triregionum]|nr:HTH-type transcriptional regulator RcdA [Pseudoclavibacter triregionum]
MARIPVAERRDALIAATIRVMEREGIGETTTRKIAAEAGMPLASLHYAFSSRGELIAAATRTLAEEVSLEMLARIDVHDELEASIVRTMTGYADYLRENPGRINAFLDAQVAGLRIPELNDVARNRVERGYEMGSYFLLRAAAVAGAEYTQPVRELAACLLQGIDGFCIHWLATRDDAILDRSIQLLARAIANASRPLADSERQAALESFKATFEGLAPRSVIEGEATVVEAATGAIQIPPAEPAGETTR